MGLTAVPRSPAATAAAGPNISNLCSLVSEPPASYSRCAAAPRRDLRGVGGGCGSVSHQAQGSHLYAPSLGTAFFTPSVFSHSLGKSIQWGQGWAGLYLDIYKRCIFHQE